MNTLPTGAGIALVVANPHSLQHGSTPRHRFGIAGGSIGSQGASWILVDKGRRVLPVHCEIRHSDGFFCVVDTSGHTRVNDAGDPLGSMVGARLRDGDILHIGPYQVAVHLQDDVHGLPDPARHLAQYEVAELLNARGDDMETLPQGLYSFEQDPVNPGADAAFHALAKQRDPQADLDPLRALDAAERTERQPAAIIDLAAAPHAHMGSTPTQPDHAATRYAAVAGAPQTSSGVSRMSKSRDHFVSDPTWPTPSPGAHSDALHPAAPLQQALGMSPAPLDLTASRTLMREAGEALGAAIRGIADLYADPVGDERRLTLNSLTLQPIEDNPLRLKQSYHDTLQALFSSERSVVHLSPAAAVEESMAQLKVHQTATIKGIEAGLHALMRAFSPDLLLQRFHRYRPEQSQQTDAGDWAWKMYAHYYDELSSTRQSGFEKLFWEVFEQAYDRALRAEAQ